MSDKELPTLEGQLRDLQRQYHSLRGPWNASRAESSYNLRKRIAATERQIANLRGEEFAQPLTEWPAIATGSPLYVWTGPPACSRLLFQVDPRLWQDQGGHPVLGATHDRLPIHSVAAFDRGKEKGDIVLYAVN